MTNIAYNLSLCRSIGASLASFFIKYGSCTIHLFMPSHHFKKNAVFYILPFRLKSDIVKLKTEKAVILIFFGEVSVLYQKKYIFA